MNLLTDPWIPVRRRSGVVERIRPHEITAQFESDPIVDLAGPRADFDGALIQFLIGLVQTDFAPRDPREWRLHYDRPPTPTDLESAWSESLEAFELLGDGARFEQDLGLEAGTAMRKPIDLLLIETPGENALRNNTDLFVKREDGRVLCPPCAAAALFSLQTNAPSGGRGNLTGLRGGGPLSTVLLTETLWRTVWMNVLPEAEFLRSGYGNPAHDRMPDRFPWLAPTRGSEGGRTTAPDDVHPAQVFWSLPRRLRLIESHEGGACDLCSEYASPVVGEVLSSPHGVKYWDQWPHPLTPSKVARDGRRGPLHARRDGLTYRDWVGLLLADPGGSIHPAANIEMFLGAHDRGTRGEFRIWSFGFAMDKAKALRWAESRMPILLPGQDRREVYASLVVGLVRLADHAARAVKKRVREAFARRPKDLGGSAAPLVRRFLERTETDFFGTQGRILEALEGDMTPEPALRDWHAVVARAASGVFDEAVQPAEVSATYVERAARAWNHLRRDLYGRAAWECLGLTPPLKPVPTKNGASA